MVLQCFLCKKTEYLHPELSFHRFPKTSERKSIWLNCLGFSLEKILPSSARLCSSHFNDDDFLFTTSGKKFVKKNVKPKSLPSETFQEQSSSLYLKMDVKQEAEDHFIGEMKIEIDEQFISDEIIYNLPIKQENSCDNSEFDVLQETCTKPESNRDQIVDDANQKSQMRDFKQDGKFNIRESEETNSSDGSIICYTDDAGLNEDLKNQFDQVVIEVEESQEIEDDAFLQSIFDEVYGKYRKSETDVNKEENRTEKTPLKCETCSKTFKRKDYYHMHMRMHTGEKPFRCKVCFKCFSRNDVLKKHMLIHTAEKSFKCNICCKSFTLKQNLIPHLRSHSGEKPYKCHICSKRFTGKSYLNIHTRCHTGENTFKCEICFKCFPVKSYLKRHLRCHTEENALSKPLSQNMPTVSG